MVKSTWQSFRNDVEISKIGR